MRALESLFVADARRTQALVGARRSKGVTGGADAVVACVARLVGTVQIHRRHTVAPAMVPSVRRVKGDHGVALLLKGGSVLRAADRVRA